MKTTEITPKDFQSSVLAVPPVALTENHQLNEQENRKLIAHIEQGGVRTLLYGGNANLHHYSNGLFSDLVGFLASAVAKESWAIPSIGPTFGKMVDEARILNKHAFPCAMILPLQFPKTADGIEQGVRQIVQVLGKPIIIYIKEADYLPAARLASLMARGEICGIKYAVPRPDHRSDPYLDDIIKCCDRTRIVSGFGELPAIPHLDAFDLAGFTAGAVCLAPRRSMAILAALQAKDMATAEELLAPIRPLEALRETHSPIRVLHEAVTLSGVGDMGPMLPLLSNLEQTHHASVRECAIALLKGESPFMEANAA